MSEFLVPLNSQRARDILSRLSVYIHYHPAAAKAAADLLRRSYPMIFSRMEIRTFARESLMLELPGSGVSEPLLFLSHLDANPLYRIENNNTVQLSRAHLICLMEALEELLREGYRPSGDLILCLSMDGLSGGEGASEMASWLEKRGIKPELVLDYGGYVSRESFVRFVPSSTLLALVGIGEKGEILGSISAAENGEHRHPAENVLRAGAALTHFSSHRRLCEASKKMLLSLSAHSKGLRSWVCTKPGLFFPLFGLLWHNQSVDDLFFRSERRISAFQADAVGTLSPHEAQLKFRQSLIPGEDSRQMKTSLRRIAKSHHTELNIDQETTATDCAPTSGPCWDAIGTAIEIQFERSLILPCLCPYPTDSRYYRNFGVYRFSPFLLNEKQAHQGICNLDDSALQTAVQFFRSMLLV